MSKKFEIAFEEVQEPIDGRTIEQIDEEHQRLALEIDEDSREIEYQSDLVQGLESLRMIACQLDTPTSTQVALFKVAANMAVAGTKQSAQDFLPAMESNKSIALEGFTDKIKEIVKAIIEMIKKIYNKTKQFILNLFKSKEAKEKEVEQTIERLKETKPEEKHNVSKTVSLTSYTERNKTTDTLSIYKHGLEHAIRYLVSKEIISNRKLTINDVHNVCITKTKLNNFIKDFTDNFIKDFMKFHKELINIDLSRLRLYYNSEIHKAELERLDNDLNIQDIRMSFVKLENDFNRQFGDTQLGQIVSLKCDINKLNFDIHSSKLMDDNTGKDYGVEITFDNFSQIRTLFDKSEYHNLPLSNVNELNDKLIVITRMFEMKTGDKDVDLQNSLIVKKIKEAMNFIHSVSLLNSNVLTYNNFVLVGITKIVYAAEKEYRQE